jgi:hypothetical protein
MVPLTVTFPCCKTPSSAAAKLPGRVMYNLLGSFLERSIFHPNPQGIPCEVSRDRAQLHCVLLVTEPK